MSGTSGIPLRLGPLVAARKEDEVRKERNHSALLREKCVSRGRVSSIAFIPRSQAVPEEKKEEDDKEELEGGPERPRAPVYNPSGLDVVGRTFGFFRGAASSSRSQMTNPNTTMGGSG